MVRALNRVRPLLVFVALYALGDGSTPCVPGQAPVESGACYPISQDPVGSAMPPDDLCPVGLVTNAVDGPCGRDLPHPPPVKP